MNTKSIAWALVSATAIITSTGFFIAEFGIALASVMFGGAAMVLSLFARRSTLKHSEENTIETGLL